MLMVFGAQFIRLEVGKRDSLAMAERASISPLGTKRGLTLNLNLVESSVIFLLDPGLMRYGVSSRQRHCREEDCGHFLR